MTDILTVTLNAAVDTTLILAGPLRVGESQTAGRVLRSPGGKGVNVARVLHTLGARARATGLVGGPAAPSIIDGLSTEGIAADFFAIAGASRTNVALAEERGDGTLDPRVTEVNEPGPTVSADEADRFLRHLDGLLPEAGAIVLSGSLPPGLPDDYYARIIVRARDAGVPAFLDTGGRGARAALAARPLLIKPNRAEASAVLGRAVDGVAAAATAGDALRRDGAGAVALTLGAEGAVLVTGAGAWRAHVDAPAGLSAVGSGDAFLAGLLSSVTRAVERGDSPTLAAALEDENVVVRALSLAVACGAANTLRLGAGVLDVADVARLERAAVVETVAR